MENAVQINMSSMNAGKKIIAKFLTRIAAVRNKDDKNNWGYNDEHDQEHHDDWTWNDHG